MVDRYECRECGLRFEAKRPENVKWVSRPRHCPHTGIWDPEHGVNTGDSMPTCPRGHKYIRRLT